MGNITLSTRSIRTFVLRQGRLTDGQQRSIDLHWDRLGLEVQDRAFDFSECFGRCAPVWMEIGFGNGEALAHMAEANPAINFLGVEVHLPGVGHALGEVAARGLENVRIVRYDALELLERHIKPSTIERLSLFFPDPWHKTRHHKRRIVNEEFLRLLEPVLANEAVLHIATDWSSYASHIRQAIVSHQSYSPLLEGPLLQKIVAERPDTKFEQRGVKLGHGVYDLVYQMDKSPQA